MLSGRFGSQVVTLGGGGIGIGTYFMSALTGGCLKESVHLVAVGLQLSCLLTEVSRSTRRQQTQNGYSLCANPQQ